MKTNYNVKLKLIICTIVLLLLFIGGCTEKEPPKKVTLNDIVVDSSKVKVEYVIGEELSLDNLVVTAKYSDDTTKVVTNYSVDKSGYNSLEEGNYRILINYTEDDISKVGIYSVSVVSILSKTNYLKGIDVMPRNVEFLVGSEFNTEELVVNAVYIDDTTKDVTSLVTIDSSKYDKNVVGVYEIIITYKEVYGNGLSAVTIEWDSFYFARVVTNLSEGDK